MNDLSQIVVVGNGMVGHRFLTEMIDRNALDTCRMVTFAEEPRVAYDRVGISSYFDGKNIADLTLVNPGQYDHPNFTLHLADKVVSIDRDAKTVTSAAGKVIPYDKLILATGSYPFVPPIPGNDAAGNFVYRTIDDLQAIEAYAENCKVGAVVGGGLLGLEAANALQNLGLETHVVEFAPRLMTVQVDDAGGALLKRKIETLGVHVHTATNTKAITTVDGRVHQMQFVDDIALQTDMIVFSCGIRPRDDLAKACGIDVGPRGGIVINDACQTSDPDVYAIGECALWNERIFGLVAPGYAMAKVCADQLTQEAPSIFIGADMSTKLKLLGVDVASFGDAFAKTPGARSVAITDDITDTYKKIVISEDASTLLGGILVGDAADYAILHQMMLNETALPPHPQDLILPARDGNSAPTPIGVTCLLDSASICSCNNVTKADICNAICADGLTTLSQIKKFTNAATGCGGCAPLVTQILNHELTAAGVDVNDHLCEHFPYSRQALFDLVRVKKIRTFADLIATHGKGHGCEICKPAVASILASTWNDHVLDPDHAPLQDTNDHFLANMQKDGTYSVIPRIPGGEITPDKLIVIGQVAKKYNLYTKITGAQRVDLLGARVDQLPHIWTELIDAGFESGHAYGKALRTVKSCVGETWCRYGVQDSVALAIEIENRYKGIRAPHKIKSAVSGCTRECAEAQSKDFGVIATEKGWNLYLGGNGGMKPQHAQLFASDLDKEALIRTIDRYLIFYIRTADRLQRTASWLNQLPGGLDYLRRVIVDDELGIAAELDAGMAHLVDTYQCEWKTALADPQKRKRFRHFVNTDQPDDNLHFVTERYQIRPARPEEKVLLTVGGAPLTAGEPLS
jgi:nitrite reductase (NADH) large subunit